MQEDQDVWSTDLLHFHLSHYPINLIGMTEHQPIKSVCLGKKICHLMNNLTFYTVVLPAVLEGWFFCW